MNYCTNCGTPVEPDWKVCANCGNILLGKEIVTKTQEESEIKIEEVKAEIPKIDETYYKTQAYQGPPHRTNAIIALISGIIGVGLLFLFIMLKIFILYVPYNLVVSVMAGNVLIIILGNLAFIFGIIGIVKDDSKGMAIVGLILGIVNFILLGIKALIPS